MKTPNLNEIESETEKKYKKKAKRKKIKMRVSGGNVKNLQKIISKKVK
jgi:hypothetical protein